MKRPRIVAEALLVAWMGLAIGIYLLVTLPADTPLAGLVPEFVLRMRAIVYPFFFSKSLLS